MESTNLACQWSVFPLCFLVLYISDIAIIVAAFYTLRVTITLIFRDVFLLPGRGDRQRCVRRACLLNSVQSQSIASLSPAKVTAQLFDVCVFKGGETCVGIESYQATMQKAATPLTAMIASVFI